MKIVLDLKNSFNNYHWKDEKELKDYIDYMLSVLWKHQKDLADSEEDLTNLEDRLYDMLDMFNDFKIEK